MSEDISRRKLLQAAAVAPVAVVAPVSSAPVVGGVIGSAAQAAPSIPFWLRNGFVPTLESLNEYLFDSSSIKDKVSDDYMNACVTGTIDWHNICYDEEYQLFLTRLYGDIKRLPAEISPLTYFSKESFQFSYGGAKTPMDEIKDVVHARKLRNLIAPFCDDETTFLDIQKTIEKNFDNLFLFINSHPNLVRENVYRIRDFFREIPYGYKIAERTKAYEFLNKITDEKSAERSKKRYQEHQKEKAAEQRKWRREEAIRRKQAESKRAKELKEKRENPSKRDTFKVYVSDGGGKGLYIVEKARTRAVLTHHDWYSFARDIDAAVKLCDVTIQFNGAVLYIKNEAVCGVVDAAIAGKFKTGQGLILLANQKKGVDLNELCPVQ